MPARDAFHQAVRQALIKDGWTITDDPLIVEFGGVDLYIDLAAEKLIAAEKEGVSIAVEIKSFLSASVVSEFHTALGQFINYRLVLQEKDPPRVLYLAIPSDIYRTFFMLTFTQRIIAQYSMKLLVYHPETEEVRAWIN
jgi:hypothetical protein